MMDYALSARPMLDVLSQGNLMRLVIGRFVQGMAVLVAIGFVAWWIAMWGMTGSLSGIGAMALTFSQIVMLAAFAKIVQVMFVRGQDICNLPESDFTMMSIFATLMRLPGEMALIFFALFSVPAMFLTWAGAGHVVAAIGVPVSAFGTGNAFVAGIFTFATCWMLGFVALVAFYLMAEVTGALFSIAHDLRKTRQAFEMKGVDHAEPTHAKPAYAEPAPFRVA